MEPKIRLQGFNGDWSNDTIGNIATFSKGRGYSKSDLRSEGNPLILYGRLYTNYSTVIKSVDTYATLKTGSVLSKGNEVIIPGSGETPEDIAVASAVEQKGVILGGDLNIVTFNPDKIVPAFAAMSITNSKTHRELSGYAQGKTVVHLHNSNIAKGHISYPTKDEQLGIAAYISSLDDLIQSTTKKIESLKQVKAASLQSMFPQEGETAPRVRFKGFEGEWETETLANTGFMTAGGTPSTYNSDYWNGNINWLQSGAIQNCIIYPASVEKKITEKGLAQSSAYLIRKDSVLIAITGATCANIGFLTFASAANQSVVSIETYEKYDSMFIYQNLLTQRSQILSFKGGSAQSGVSLGSLKKVLIQCPKSRDEQKVIGKYFSSLDSQITLYTQRLEKLQQIKSACLDNMLV